MKYIKTFQFIVQVVLCVGLIMAAIYGVCLLCSALLPVVSAVIVWMARHAIVGAMVCAIGFAVWFFGDVCDAQVRRERKNG